MKITKEEKQLLKKLGFEQVPENENDQLELYKEIENVLLNEGITNDKVNKIGLVCEKLLDKLED